MSALSKMVSATLKALNLLNYLMHILKIIQTLGLKLVPDYYSLWKIKCFGMSKKHES